MCIACRIARADGDRPRCSRELGLRDAQASAGDLDWKALWGVSPRPPHTSFWPRVLPQQIDGSLGDCQLGPVLGDLLLGGGQLSHLGRRQAGMLAAADAIWPTQGVDRLVAEVEIGRDAPAPVSSRVARAGVSAGRSASVK